MIWHAILGIIIVAYVAVIVNYAMKLWEVLPIKEKKEYITVNIRDVYKV